MQPNIPERRVPVQSDEVRLWDAMRFCSLLTSVHILWSIVKDDVFDFRGVAAVAHKGPEPLRGLVVDQKAILRGIICTDALHQDVVLLADDHAFLLAILVILMLIDFNLPRADPVLLVVVEDELVGASHVAHLCTRREQA